MKKGLMAIGLLVVAAMICCMPVLASEGKPEEEAAGVIEQAKDYLEDAFENMDPETAGELFEFLKEKAADGSLKTEEGVRGAIKEGEERFDAQMDEKAVEKLVETMEKLEDIGFSAEHVIEKTEGLYQEYGSNLSEHLDEIVTETVKEVVKETFISAIKKFFITLRDAIVRLFKSLF